MCELVDVLPYVALAVLCPEAIRQIARGRLEAASSAASASASESRDDAEGNQ